MATVTHCYNQAVSHRLSWNTKQQVKTKTSLVIIAHNLRELRLEDFTTRESADGVRKVGGGTLWYKYIKEKHIHEAQLQNNGVLCPLKCHCRPTSPSAVEIFYPCISGSLCTSGEF